MSAAMVKEEPAMVELSRIVEELRVKVSNLESIVNAKETSKRADCTIKLNLRGKVFETTIETLVRIEGTYFYGLVRSGTWMPNKDGILHFSYG